MRFRKLVLALGFAFLSAGVCLAHDQNDFAKEFKKRHEDFIEDKINLGFPNLDTLRTINGETFHFNSINKPAIVYIGFAGCTPCRFEMPLLIKMANEKKNAGYDFVYMTYDEPATITEEVKGQAAADLARVKIVRISKSVIDEEKLTLGYPTKYFLNSDRSVNAVETGGRTDNAEKVIEDWRVKLALLK